MGACKGALGGRPVHKIKVASTAGFCFGVDRAVKLTYSVVEKGGKVCTLGPVIHNPQVMEDLQAKGVKVISQLSQADEGSTVVIRAHGVSREVENELLSMPVEVCDATCPFVEKIHKIVGENSGRSVPVIIAGNPDHPEVIGIKGHCNGEVFIVSSEAELEQLFAGGKIPADKPVTAVAQTTFNEKEWILIKKILNKHCTNPKIFDTICFATHKRQQEAAQLSKQSDIMIIIGGRESSNTAKLKAVCNENCETHLVERVEELKTIDFSRKPRIGVTAGASTPAAIIKEVLLTMSEELKVNNENMVEEVPSEDFESLLEANLEQMSSDQHVIGTVMSINNAEIQVDIGRKQAGFVPVEEYSADPSADPKKDLKVGDEIDLIIMKTNDAEGTVMCSKKRYDAQKSWIDVAAAAESGEVLEGTVTEVIRGGVLVVTNGARVFIPASLATSRRTQPLEELVGQKVKFVVIEVNNARKRAVGSIRKVRDAARDAFWEQVAVGQVYQGTVKSLTPFGAFVEIAEGVEGLVHISELSWKRIKNPAEVLEVGQTIEVFVKALDSDKKKISLGYKKDEDNPWKILEKDYPVGSVIDSKIVSLTTFGAFATVIPGIDGLIHISQIADRRIDKPSDVLSVGDEVKVKITDIDFDKKRVSLSIRALIEPEEKAEDEIPAAEYIEEPVVIADEIVAPVEEAPAAEEAPAEEATPAVEETAPVEEASVVEEAPAEEAAPAEEPAE